MAPSLALAPARGDPSDALLSVTLSELKRVAAPEQREDRSMSDRRALSTARLLVARAHARTGLLATAAITIAAATATVSLVLVWLARSVETAGDPPPPGVDAE
ncbi:MAG: hypothetical protein WBX17_07560, partial [Microbacterium sp.]